MRFYLLFPLIFTLFACQAAKKDQYPDGSVRVKIPHWTAEGYQLQIVELQTVRDMVELKGDAAHFIIAPRISGSRLIGNAPQIRTMRNSDGVYIASDETSLELLTTYYHMEKLKEMDELVGAGQVNTWPRQVALSENLFDPLVGQIKNNALYSGEYDSILMLPYTQETLPLAVNGGILGHEHFHSLFQKIFIDSLGDKYPQESSKLVSEKNSYHSHMLRGLNEGLADYWGWLYSQDDNFVGRSLSEYPKQRDLSRPFKNIPNEACFKQALSRGGGRSTTVKSYEFGTQIAKWQRELTLRLQKEKGLSLLATRVLLGHALIRALQSYAKEFAAMGEGQTMAPGHWVETFLTQIPELSQPLKEWSMLQKSKDDEDCKGR